MEYYIGTLQKVLGRGLICLSFPETVPGKPVSTLTVKSVLILMTNYIFILGMGEGVFQKPSRREFFVIVG